MPSLQATVQHNAGQKRTAENVGLEGPLLYRKKNGCRWEGELRLEKHEREDCEWVLMQCIKCGESFPRRWWREHECDECRRPQRPMDVKFESFMRKMEERHQRVMAELKREHEAKIEQLEQSLKEMRGEPHKY